MIKVENSKKALIKSKKKMANHKFYTQQKYLL